MRLKKILGWAGVTLITVLPVFLLFYLGPPVTFSYSDVTQKLGQIAGLAGFTLFALNFVFSTRAKFLEEIFGGLDKVYRAHGVIGGLSLSMILFHPILLVLKFIPSDVAKAAGYLVPSSYWSVNFGIIALLGMITLLVMTFYIKMRYNYWKFSHKFMGAVFIIAVLHVFLVRGVASKDYIFAGYYDYTAVISFIGISCFLYTLLIKNAIWRASVYTIEKIKKRKNTYEIILKPEKKQISYKSGQFIFVKFHNRELTKESHPFSVASSENKIRIIAKNLGDFTSNMEKLKIGDKVAVEGAYGRFNFGKKKEQIWIAGGIGITPFIGMAEDLKDRKADLYYSVKNEDEFIMLDELKDTEKKNKNFRIIQWVTSKQGHLSAEEIRKRSGEFEGKEFYLCGPAKMKEELKKELRKMGVNENSIFDEEFNFL